MPGEINRPILAELGIESQTKKRAKAREDGKRSRPQLR
jgi:hypothetical protein